MRNVSIDIGLATFNGADYLDELLQSLEAQSYRGWRIVARDDCSTDGTVEVLVTFREHMPAKMIILENAGCRQGAVGNFSSIMSSMTGDYFMLCDQDDVWKSEKVERSMAKMVELERRYGADIPLLVHTDLNVVDKDLNPIASSFFKYQNLNPYNTKYFNRLLVENVVTGCTLVGNRRLREMAGEIPGEAIMHDWWLALIASAFGQIGFINAPTVLYRQHDGNQEGAKKYDPLHVAIQAYNVFFRKERFKFSIERSQRQALAFLNRYADRLDSGRLTSLSVFCDLRNQGYIRSRFNIFKYGFLITGFTRNLAFFFRL
jgi:glycosyltransferase involved in cell wall biosynthesis